MTLDKLIAETNKHFGGNVLRKAREVPVIERIPTGVFSLDVATGGGVPLSRITLFTGEWSGGKTSVALKTAANAQRLDRATLKPAYEADPQTGELVRKGESMRVLFIDAEGSFDPDWAATLGVNVDEMLITNLSQAEKTYDLVLGLMKTGGIDLIILDSLAALAPGTEVESSLEDQQMGLAARINNKGFRLMIAAMNELEIKGQRGPAVILINQIRHKLSPYGNPETTPGGRGQNYAAALEVRFRPTGKPILDGERMVGRTYSFAIQKNKVTGVLTEGSYVLYVDDSGPFRKGDVDSVAQILDWAVRLRLVEKGGAWLTLPDGTRHQGRDNAALHLIQHPQVCEELRAAVVAASRRG